MKKSKYVSFYTKRCRSAACQCIMTTPILLQLKTLTSEMGLYVSRLVRQDVPTSQEIMILNSFTIIFGLLIGVLTIHTQSVPVNVCKTGPYGVLVPVSTDYRPAQDFYAIFFKPTCINKVKRTSPRSSTTTTTCRPSTTPSKDPGKALSILKGLAASVVKTLWYVTSLSNQHTGFCSFHIS